MTIVGHPVDRSRGPHRSRTHVILTWGHPVPLRRWHHAAMEFGPRETARPSPMGLIEAPTGRFAPTRVIEGLRRLTRPVVFGLLVVGMGGSLLIALVIGPSMHALGGDAVGYWLVDLPDPYQTPWHQPGAFVYAPPIALVFDWFDRLDWWVFSFLWLLVGIGSVVWLAWTPFWILVAFSFPFVVAELYEGNIHLLMAVAIVLGFRHPWTWSFVLLTKPSSGVGLLWFVVRREWRQLGVALGVTAVICLATWVYSPELWRAWIDLLVTNVAVSGEGSVLGVSLGLRVAAAAALVVWGARTDRRWTVVVSSMLALPALWPVAFAMLIAVIPEFRSRVRYQPIASPDRGRNT